MMYQNNFNDDFEKKLTKKQAKWIVFLLAAALMFFIIFGL